ncbi:ferritin family protein [Pontiellaceae bacterium B1224]|nr:ferritin family protein [Pontiellaceae bacterium B1224]
MSQERVLDIIDHARKFYSQLSKYYDEMSAVADQARVKMLLNYLSACEKRHEQALAEYEKSAPKDVIDTWYKCGADKVEELSCNPLKLTSDMDIDTILREALRLDECLSVLYQEAIDRAQTPRIKEVFTNLIESNKKDMRNLVRDCGHLRDL